MIAVTVTYDAHWKAFEWAKENCPSYITNAVGPAKLHSLPGGWVTKYYDIIYYFSDEKDAVLFALRWT